MKLIPLEEKAFQDTSIGKFPKDWRISRIGEVADINSRSTNPREELTDSEFSYIDIDSVERGSGFIKTPQKVLGKNAPSRARRVVLENDVIMSTVRPYLKAFALVPNEYDRQICSTGFAVLTCKKEIMPYYLLTTLFSDIVISQCKRMMVGGQYPALNSSQVSNILIPLPNLPEQQGISKILSAVDMVIQKTQEIIIKTERLKKGLMQQLLTRGIGHKEFKDTEIGKIPKTWEVADLGNMAFITKLAGFEYTKYFKYDENGEIIVLRGLNIKNQALDLSDIKRIPKEISDALPRSKVCKNDIVFTYVGTIGEAAIVPESNRFHLGANVAKISISKENKISPLFLLYILKSATVAHQVAARASLTAQASFSMHKIRRLRIQVPPLSEQKQITNLLYLVDMKIKLEKYESVKLERLKQALMNLLLTGKVRVRVD